MKKFKLLGVVLWVSFMFGAIPAIFAQDIPTPTAEVPTPEFVTLTPDATDVGGVPPVGPTVEPTTEVTPEPTPPPVENPIDANVILPYLGAGWVIAILGIIGVAGAGLLLLFRSTPAGQFISKTIGPPLGDAGVAAYEEYAKLTPATFDDDLAKQLRAEWEIFKKKLLEDVATAQATTKAQIPQQIAAQVKPAVDKAMSQNNIGTLS